MRKSFRKRLRNKTHAFSFTFLESRDKLYVMCGKFFIILKEKTFFNRKIWGMMPTNFNYQVKLCSFCTLLYISTLFGCCTLHRLVKIRFLMCFAHFWGKSDTKMSDFRANSQILVKTKILVQPPKQLVKSHFIYIKLQQRGKNKRL